jgi:hypothetical protein
MIMLTHALVSTVCERRSPRHVEDKADLQRTPKNISSKAYSHNMKVLHSTFQAHQWTPMILGLVGQVHILHHIQHHLIPLPSL